MKIVLASKNKGKIEEFSKILKSLNIEILDESIFNDSEIIENGNTFEENSLIKAKTIAKISNLITIADDSGLCIEKLDNWPGIYTARVFPECEDYRQKCKKMIKKVNEANIDRKAKFVCVITLYNPNNDEYFHFRGESYGYITDELIGDKGHGYDPIFYSIELNKTFAEMNLEEKNRISHRGKATKLLIEYIKNNFKE